MEDVRCDGNVDIHEWQMLPERVKDGLDPIISTRGMEGAYITVGQCVSSACFLIVTGQETVAAPKLIVWDFAFGAFTVVHTSNQDLFRVIANEISQYGMASAPGPIPTHHR